MRRTGDFRTTNDLSVSSFGPDSPYHQHQSRGLTWDLGWGPDVAAMTLGGTSARSRITRSRMRAGFCWPRRRWARHTFGEPRGIAVIHWIIPQEDLAEKRFDRVEAVKAQVH